MKYELLHNWVKTEIWLNLSLTAPDVIKSQKYLKMTTEQIIKKNISFPFKVHNEGKNASE